MTHLSCVQAATEILGDKWTPVLLRCFINEPTVRFCQLQDMATGINPRTLSARLVMLETKGIVEKSATSTAARCEYSLTPKGQALLPVLESMAQWSRTYA